MGGIVEKPEDYSCRNAGNHANMNCKSGTTTPTNQIFSFIFYRELNYSPYIDRRMVATKQMTRF
jgi:hypothetical protein